MPLILFNILLFRQTRPNKTGEDIRNTTRRGLAKNHSFSMPYIKANPVSNYWRASAQHHSTNIYRQKSPYWLLTRSQKGAINTDPRRARVLLLRRSSPSPAQAQGAQSRRQRRQASWSRWLCPFVESWIALRFPRDHPVPSRRRQKSLERTMANAKSETPARG